MRPRACREGKFKYLKIEYTRALPNTQRALEFCGWKWRTPRPTFTIDLLGEKSCSKRLECIVDGFSPNRKYCIVSFDTRIYKKVHPHNREGMRSRESSDTVTSSSNGVRTSNSSSALLPSPTPTKMTPPPSKQNPMGFRMNGGARELHGNAIYCVAWSTDMFQEDCSPQQNDNDEKDNNNNHSDEQIPETQQQQQPLLPRQVRYVATCGGNHVTMYEVEIPSSRKKRTDGLTLRQAYVDTDKDESFYCCVFGGRSLGRPFGYEPVHNGGIPIVLGNQTMDNGDTTPIVGETRWREDVNKDDGFHIFQGDTTKVDSEDNSLQGETTSQEVMSNGSGNSVTTHDLGRQLFQAMTDMQTFDGPQLLCVAGTRGVIKVIDTVRQMLSMTLTGHGKDIYDLKFSPTDEWLLLSASKDESIRLWNVKKATCVAIFAGHDGHRDAVLAVGWHSWGDRFASAGMDTTVKLWRTGEGSAVYRALQASNSVQAQTWDDASSHSAPPASKFRTIYEQMPYFSTNKVHTDYVDCVRFVGDLLLSKSISNTVVLWKPEFTRTLRHGTSKPTHQRLPNEVIALREFTINKCNVWFIRFDTNVDSQMLALGNTVGEIKVWEIDDNPKKKCLANLVQQFCTSTVRMVAFSPDSKCLIAACEDATLWKWDAHY